MACRGLLRGRLQGGGLPGGGRAKRVRALAGDLQNEKQVIPEGPGDGPGRCQSDEHTG